MNRRLGCLTGGGLFAAALTLALVLVFYLARGGGMFSPGALNAQVGDQALGDGAVAPVRSHAETGGRCAACHTAPWSSVTLSDRCQACHSQVANELGANQGVHAQLKGQADSIDCRGCHPEHRGATAALIEIRPDTFPHEATGYALSGHEAMADGRPFACGDCHVESVMKFAQATCTDCHSQLDASYIAAHLADFGQACLDCHDGVDRYGRERFSHDSLAFPLDGRHEEIACRECHAGAITAAGLQSAQTKCVDCHLEDDAHEGRFGAECAGCHNTTSWPDAQFDHALTTFPLTGKHVNVECEDCHEGGAFKGTSAECVSCHEDPAFHRGAFSVQCQDCHTAEGWQPATFNERHTFPLDHGEEETASCRACHPDNVATYTCYGCHEHTPAETIAQHADETNEDITDCVRCHPTGQEAEEGGQGRDAGKVENTERRRLG